MPDTLIATFPADYWLVEVCLPGQAPETVGVMVRNPQSGDFRVRFRRDWESFAGDEAEVLELLEEDLSARLSEPGAADWLRLSEDSWSHTVRFSERNSVLSHDLDRTAARLYREHVRPTVLPYWTHLPLYTLRAAAGRFLDNAEVSEEAWLEAPAGLRLTGGMFAAHIQGRSMEPRIPDGSLCVFRSDVAGSRQGKLVLVERLDVADQYTVKRYRSQWRESAEGRRQEWVRLEPLNPEFEAWELDPEDGRFRVLAEFVRVLDPEC